METTLITSRNGNVVDVGGVPTYYEVTGSGEPLVFLHGGMCTAETVDPQVPALAERYRVYVPERFGHGRTPDIDGPITYENMAEHTAGFMDAVGIESAHVAGWSDGALVALLVALRRPKLVRKVVVIDQFISTDRAPAFYPALMDTLTVETFPSEFVELYNAFSPDGPEHFPVVFEKVHTLWTGATGLEVEDLARVAAPTLVLAADSGSITPEHAGEIIEHLPDWQLAFVPGTSHGLTLEKPHIVNQLVLEFLADEQAPKLFPTG